MIRKGTSPFDRRHIERDRRDSQWLLNPTDRRQNNTELTEWFDTALKKFFSYNQDVAADGIRAGVKKRSGNS